MKLYREEIAEKHSTDPSSQRLTQLQKRPLYCVWEVRQTLGPAKAALEKVRTLDGLRTYKNDDAERLERATRSARSVAQYAISMRAYLQRSEWHISPLQITEKQYDGLLVGPVTMNTTLADFESCKLAKLMGRQP